MTTDKLYLKHYIIFFSKSKDLYENFGNYL